jgi:hypothetical protein
LPAKSGKLSPNNMHCMIDKTFFLPYNWGCSPREYL